MGSCTGFSKKNIDFHLWFFAFVSISVSVCQETTPLMETLVTSSAPELPVEQPKETYLPQAGNMENVGPQKTYLSKAENTENEGPQETYLPQAGNMENVGPQETYLPQAGNMENVGPQETYLPQAGNMENVGPQETYLPQAGNMESVGPQETYLPKAEGMENVGPQETYLPQAGNMENVGPQETYLPQAGNMESVGPQETYLPKAEGMENVGPQETYLPQAGNMESVGPQETYLPKAEGMENVGPAEEEQNINGFGLNGTAATFTSFPRKRKGFFFYETFSLNEEGIKKFIKGSIKEDYFVAGAGGIRIDPSKYVASVRVYPSEFHCCSATFISKSVLITSARCIFGRDPSKTFIHASSRLLEMTGYSVPVKTFHIHPEFELSPSLNNIGIIGLWEPLNDVIPLSLPPRKLQIFNFDKFIIHGWQFSRGRRIFRLRGTRGQYISNAKCQIALREKLECETTVCAGNAIISHGSYDEGLPLIQARNNMHYIVGIYNRQGIVPRVMIDKYEKIFPHLQWINLFVI